MGKLTKTSVYSLAGLLLAGSLLAADAKKGAVLHPEMTVAADAGSYDKPAGKMGDKTGDPWSATTVAAAVDKQTQPGKAITVAGEIMDLSCYLQVGKHGEKHKACGVKCLGNGQPIGLLTKNGVVYLLMEEEHDPRRDSQTAFRQAAIDNFAKIVEVTGTETEFGGYRAIYVSGYVKK